jgi:hypothetical protein
LLGGNPVRGCRLPGRDKKPGAEQDDACAQQPR